MAIIRAKLPNVNEHLAVKAAPDRLHALVPGCVMLRSLMGALGARTMRFCRYGLREGYLVERMLG